MNDDELRAVRGSLIQARNSLPDVHMWLPATALVASGRARRRRRWIAGGTLAAAVAASMLLAGVLPASGRPVTSVTAARTVAYVVQRVERTLASERLVFAGRTTGSDGPSVTWVYGSQSRFEEVTGDECGHTFSNGDCTYRGGSVPYLAMGTALVHGKLTGAYVTYFDHRYSLSRRWTAPPSACSRTSALTMGGPPVPTPHWSAFIQATLACGAASVTGPVRVDGIAAMKITGKPVTVRLPAGYGRLVSGETARAQWVCYVSPRTYLPIRIWGSTTVSGGRGSSSSAATTDVTWLPPTRANVAKTLVTIPAGFQRWWANPSSQ